MERLSLETVATDVKYHIFSLNFQQVFTNLYEQWLLHSSNVS
jgi:hypothetical protein